MTTSSFCEDSQNLGSEINKTANIIAKTSQFETICKDDSGYITLLKQQKKNKKGDITCQHIDYVAICY